MFIDELSGNNLDIMIKAVVHIAETLVNSYGMEFFKNLDDYNEIMNSIDEYSPYCNEENQIMCNGFLSLFTEKYSSH